MKQKENSKIQNMFNMLFACYLEDIKDNNIDSAIFKKYLNNMDKSYLENNTPGRIAVDFIAGMTDDYFLSQFNNLYIPQRFGYEYDG